MLIIIANVLAIIFGVQGGWNANFYDVVRNKIYLLIFQMGKFFGLVVRIFTIIMAIVIILSELGWRKIINYLHFMQGFFGRGAIELL